MQKNTVTSCAAICISSRIERRAEDPEVVNIISVFALFSDNYFDPCCTSFLGSKTVFPGALEDSYFGKAQL